MSESTDKIGRRRHPNQTAALPEQGRPGAVSRSHNVNMSEEAHAALRALTPSQRGDLITKALHDLAP